MQDLMNWVLIKMNLPKFVKMDTKSIYDAVCKILKYKRFYDIMI